MLPEYSNVWQQLVSYPFTGPVQIMMDEKFSVALDVSALCVKYPTGIAVYARGFIDELLRRPDQIDLDYYFKGKLFREYSHFFDGLKTPQRYVMKSVVPRTGKQITHSLDKRFLLDHRAINIATIHDVTYFVQGNYVESWIPKRFKSKIARSNAKIVKYADKIVTVSESTRTDLCRIYNVDPDRVRVIYPGFQPVSLAVSSENDEAILEKFDQSRQSYFLFAGRIELAKNILSMIEAFKASGLDKDLNFLIAGPSEPDTEFIHKRTIELGMAHTVKFPGYVSSEELAALYRNAKAFIFPTYYEGFGMPILESMSNGVPVLVGSRGAAPEIAGGHGIVADPFSVEEIKNGMLKLAEGGHDPDRLKAHAASFTWPRFVDQVFDLYRELLAARRSQ